MSQLRLLALVPLLMLLAACQRPTAPSAPAQTAPSQVQAPAATAGSAEPAVGAPSYLVSDPDVGEYPEPGWLLSVGDKVKLTSEQVAATKKAKAGFEADTKADRAELERQSAAFVAYLKQQGDKVDPAEATRRNEAASEASARVMAKRKQYWEPLWKTMTPDQQRQITALRARDPFQLR